MGTTERGSLVISADGAVAAAVRAVVEARGGAVRVERRLGEGLAATAGGGFAAVVVDDRLLQGWEVLPRLAAAVSPGRVVLVAARIGADAVLEAMRAGVSEVLLVPLDPSEVEEALTRRDREGDRVPLPEAAPEREVAGSSPELIRVFRTVGRVAGSDASVLLTGESGTGKELVARALHAGSPRSGGPFVAVNCAAIPENLLESELFGHERGAFTGAVARKVGRFERAHRGTLFLDEVGDMSLVLQAKILRALQEREIERVGGDERVRVDARVVAATHRDLPARITAGEFREDLFYRLAVVRIDLPPLRERRGDVRELALHFASLFAARHGRDVRWVSAEALERLGRRGWPGNVRELRNALERAVLLATGDTIESHHVEVDGPASAVPEGAVLPGYRPDLTMAQVEALHLAAVLSRVDGQIGRAAERLGMHRNTVSRKVQEYGLRGAE